MMDLVTHSVGDWSFLVHIAAVLTALGFFFRNQIILRSLIVLGSSTYIAYYYLFPDEPLWTPISWSSVFVSVNIFMIFRLLYDRVEVYNNADEANLFQAFQGFSPGMFRQLIGISKTKIAKADFYLTVEDSPLDRLYYIVDGGIHIEKDGKQFDYMAGAFVGEVAFLTGENASASVKIARTSRYIEWEHEKLNKLFEKTPELKYRLEAMFNQDMALKVKLSNYARTANPE